MKNPRFEAIQAAREARKVVAEIPNALTVNAVLEMKAAMIRLIEAMEAINEYVDAIELLWIKGAGRAEP